MIDVCMTPVDPPPSAAELLRRADWNALLPKLVAYAERRVRLYGWTQGRSYASSAMEPMELVDAAVEACLAGTWKIPPEVELATFLYNVMRALAGRRLKSSKRSKLTDAADDHAVEQGDIVEARSLLAQLYAAVSDDEEMTTLLTELARGDARREDIAEALGWTSERVRVVKQRMNRRLAKANLVAEDVLQ